MAPLRDAATVAIRSHKPIVAEDATPTITLLSGFTLCSATGSGDASGKRVTVSLADSSTSCTLAASTAASFRIDSDLAAIDTPSGGGITTVHFGIKTSADGGWLQDVAGYDIDDEIASFEATLEVGGIPANATVPKLAREGVPLPLELMFTPSPRGGLGATSTITFLAVGMSQPLFVPNAAPVVSATTGFSGCTTTAETNAAGDTMTFTLDGVSCGLAPSAPASITIASGIAPNFEAGDVMLRVKTSSDTSYTAAQTAYTVHDSEIIDFWAEPSTVAAGATPARLLLGFTTSHRSATSIDGGALSDGSSVTVTASSAIYAEAGNTVVLPVAGFQSCTFTSVVDESKQQLAVSLHGGACAVPMSHVAAFAVADNLAANAGSAGTAVTFGIKTSSDTEPATGQIGYTIDDGVSAFSLSTATVLADATAEWLAFQFTASAAGALGPSDTLVVGSDRAMFAVGSTPFVHLIGGFSHCRGTALVSSGGKSLTVTLSSRSSGSCTLTSGAVGFFSVVGACAGNGGAGESVGFSIETSSDSGKVFATPLIFAHSIVATSFAVDIDPTPAVADGVTAPTSMAITFQTSSSGLLVGGADVESSGKIYLLANQGIYTADYGGVPVACTTGCTGTCTHIEATNVAFALVGADGSTPSSDASHLTIALVTPGDSLETPCTVPADTAVTFTLTNTFSVTDGTAGLAKHPLAGLVTFDVKTSSDTGALVAQSGYMITDHALTIATFGISASPSTTIGGIHAVYSGSSPSFLALTFETSAAAENGGNGGAITGSGSYILIRASQPLFMPSASASVCAGPLDSCLMIAVSMDQDDGVHCTGMSAATNDAGTEVNIVLSATCGVASAAQAHLTITSKLASLGAAGDVTFETRTSADTAWKSSGVSFKIVDGEVSSFFANPSTTVPLIVPTSIAFGFTTSDAMGSLAAGELTAGSSIFLATHSGSTQQQAWGLMPIFAASTSAVVSLDSGFSQCAATGHTNAAGNALHIVLSNAASGSCAVSGATAVVFTVAGVMLPNPAMVWSGDHHVHTTIGFAVSTSSDTQPLVALGYSTQNAVTAFTAEVLPVNLRSGDSLASLKFRWTPTSITGALIGTSDASTTDKVHLTASEPIFSSVTTPQATGSLGFSGGCSGPGTVSDAGRTVVWPLPNGCALSADLSNWNSDRGLAVLIFEPTGLLVAGNAGDVTFDVKTTADGGLLLGVPGYIITDHTVIWVGAMLENLDTGATPAWVKIQFKASNADPDGANSGALQGSTTTAASDKVFIKASQPTFSLGGGSTVTCVGNTGLCQPSTTLPIDSDGTELIVNLLGATCSVRAGLTIDLTVTGGLAANGYGGMVTFRIRTTKDTMWLPASNGYTLIDDAVVWGDVVLSSTAAGVTPESLTATFAPSTTGSLMAGSLIWLGATRAIFTPTTPPTVEVGQGFSHCSTMVTPTPDGTSVTVELTDRGGGTCELQATMDFQPVGSLKFMGGLAPNPAVGTDTLIKFRTSADTQLMTRPGYEIDDAVSAFASTPSSSAMNISPDLTVAFTTSLAGSLAVTDTITLVASHAIWNATETSSATPVAGFTDCTLSGVATNDDTELVLTLGEPNCQLAGATAAEILLVDWLHPNPIAGTPVMLKMKTSEDSAYMDFQQSYIVGTAVSLFSITATGVASGAVPSMLQIGFTTSATGALATGQTITVRSSHRAVFASGATATSISLGGGFSSCTAVGACSSNGKAVVFTLTGAACTLAASTAGTVTMSDGLTINGDAGLVKFSILTSVDEGSLEDQDGYTITDFPVSALTAVPSTVTRGATMSSLLIGFQTAATGGALAAGATIYIRCNHEIFVPFQTSVTVHTVSGFVGCSASGSTNVAGDALTLTLSDIGQCTVAANTAVEFAVGSGLAANSDVVGTAVLFDIRTSSDTMWLTNQPGYTVDNSVSEFSVSVATSATGVIPPSLQIGFSLSSTGALAAADTVELVANLAIFYGGASIDDVILGPAFTGCDATDTVVDEVGKVAMITLGNESSQTCAIANSATATITLLSGLAANGAAGQSVSLNIRTSADTGYLAAPLTAYEFDFSPNGITATTVGSLASGLTLASLAFTLSVSGSGELGPADTITIGGSQTILKHTILDNAVTIAGAFDCGTTSAASSDGTQLTVILTNDSSTCQVDRESSVVLTLQAASLCVNGDAGPVILSAKTSKDTGLLLGATGYSITDETALWGSATVDDLDSGNMPATLDIIITTSSNGELTSTAGAATCGNNGPGALHFKTNVGIFVPGAITASFVSGSTGSCDDLEGTATSASLLVVTLADGEGAACSIPSGATVSIRVSSGLAVNGPAQDVLFDVRTSADTAWNEGQPGYSIDDGQVMWGSAVPSTSATAVTPQQLSVIFTTSATGAMANGDEIVIIANQAIFTPSANPQCGLAGGFSACAGSCATDSAGETITVALVDSSATCALATTTLGQVDFEHAMVTNGAVGEQVTFSVKTSADTLLLAAQTGFEFDDSVQDMSCVVSPLTSGVAPATMTVTFKPTTFGGLTQNGMIELFASRPIFTALSTPTIAPDAATAFGALCSSATVTATAAANGRDLVITLGAGCTVAGDLDATFTISDSMLANGEAGPVLFDIGTSEDTGLLLAQTAYTVADHTVTWGGALSLTDDEKVSGAPLPALPFLFTTSALENGANSGALNCSSEGGTITLVASQAIYSLGSGVFAVCGSGCTGTCTSSYVNAATTSAEELVITLSGNCCAPANTQVRFDVGPSGLAANGAAGAVTFGIKTSQDTSWLDAQSGYTITDTEVTLFSVAVGTTAAGVVPTELDVTFSTSGYAGSLAVDAGKLVAGSAVTLTASLPIFTAGATTSTVALRNGFTNCVASGVANDAGTTMVVTLATAPSMDGNCAGGGADSSFAIQSSLAANAAVGVVVTFDIKTSSDSQALTLQTGYTLATSIFNFSCEPESSAAGLLMNYFSFSFCTSVSTGHLGIGSQIKLLSNVAIYQVSDSVSSSELELSSTFAACSASGTSSSDGKMLVLTLASSSSTCALAASTAEVPVVATIKLLNTGDTINRNGASGEVVTFDVWTSADPGALELQPGYTVDDSVSDFTAVIDGDICLHTPNSLAIGFITSYEGQLQASDTITLKASRQVFIADVTSLAVQMTGALSSCHGIGHSDATGQTLIISLTGVTCSLGPTAQAYFTASLGLAPNGDAGSVTFSIKTSADTAFLPNQIGYTVEGGIVTNFFAEPNTQAAGATPTQLRLGFRTSSHGVLRAASTITFVASGAVYNAISPTVLLSTPTKLRAPTLRHDCSRNQFA